MRTLGGWLIGRSGIVSSVRAEVEDGCSEIWSLCCYREFKLNVCMQIPGPGVEATGASVDTVLVSVSGHSLPLHPWLDLQGSRPDIEYSRALRISGLSSVPNTVVQAIIDLLSRSHK